VLTAAAAAASAAGDTAAAIAAASSAAFASQAAAGAKAGAAEAAAADATEQRAAAAAGRACQMMPATSSSTFIFNRSSSPQALYMVSLTNVHMLNYRFLGELVSHDVATVIYPALGVAAATAALRASADAADKTVKSAANAVITASAAVAAATTDAAGPRTPQILSATSSTHSHRLTPDMCLPHVIDTQVEPSFIEFTLRIFVEVIYCR
jgi:hypothetical protein